MIKLDQTKLVGICAVNSVEYVNEIFEALASGKIAVPLRSEQDTQRIEATNLVEIITPNDTKGWFSPKYTPSLTNSIAQISFTSGTEGSPKGVVISHSALNDTVDRLIKITEINDQVKEYIGVPVYHSFGYGRCRLIGTVGGRAFIPSAGFNPSEISELLNEKQINSLSAVPSLLRVLLSVKSIFGDERLNLNWIEIGSQPMSAEEKIELRTLFPNARIVQHYGLTEASRSTLLKIDGAPVEILDSVGRATGSALLRISDEGMIQIKGDHVADSMLVDGQQKPILDEQGWFNTTDLGELKDGYLYFLGRADNVINIGGQKISAETIESAVLDQFDISGGVAATRVPSDIYGETIFLALEANIQISADTIRSYVINLISKHGVSAKNVVSIHVLDKLPLTDTGKVQRKELAELAKNSLSDAQTQTGKTGDISSQILALFADVSGSEVDTQSTINELELDSISVVGLLIKLEKLIGQLPHNIREVSVTQLIERARHNEDSGELSDVDEFLKEYKKMIPGSKNMNPKALSFWKLIKEDFATHESDLFSQGFWAVFNHRFGNWRMSVKFKLLRFPLTILYKIQLKVVQMLCGIKLDYTVKLGRRVKIEHFGGIIMGARYIGDDVTIRQNTTLGIKDLSNLQGKPIIEQGVNIGTGAVIVGDIRVGRYSVIGPNAVVDQDIPPFSTVAAPKPTISRNS